MHWSEFLLLCLLLLLAAPWLGNILARLFLDDTPRWLLFLKRVELFFYRYAAVPTEEMEWKGYLRALLTFNGVGFLVLFLILVLQGYLPLNPDQLPSVPWLLALNITTSMITNTGWQSYSGETTLSYFSQMMGITVQGFLSAATGFAVLLALTRGILRKEKETIGNFWKDLVKTVVYVLLPLSCILALILVSLGVIQTLDGAKQIVTMEGKVQTIPLGPVASEVAIKVLGSYGAGFFGANSAHPFENPSPWTNLIEQFSLLLLPAAAPFFYGRMSGKKRVGMTLFIVMALLWFSSLFVAEWSENLKNPFLGETPFLEGKETRIGINASASYAISTTATSNGSTNTSHGSLSPLSSGVALLNMMIGEVAFGGVGVGLCSLLMFVLLTLFLAGLMTGRTPEYLGKKIEKVEMRWVMLAILGPSLLILIGSAVTTLIATASKMIESHGPHGLTEVLYTFSSTAANNGSSFGSLNTNTDYFNIMLTLVMCIARLFILIPSIAIASSLAKKRVIPESLATISTDTMLFATLLFSSIALIAALAFLPALSLGPIVEELLMWRGL